jgi:magnesium chelatase accessory protein
VTEQLIWERDGPDWPNRSASRFVNAAGFTWHVQQMGQGPVVLLVHGTGASTHSWGRLMPLLAKSFTVVAPDLPGHGFTEMPDKRYLSLPGMAGAVAALMESLGLNPALAVGHSAGAAILIRATIDRRLAPYAIVSINGALLPFGSWVGQLFSPLAKLLVTAPGVARLMARRASSRSAVERVLRGTGSEIAPGQIDLYARLFRSPIHVSAALGMMANWDLYALARDLPRLETPLVLVAGGADMAIQPADAAKVRRMVKKATVISLPGLGHLAHEEMPEQMAAIILKAAQTNAVPAHA